MPRTLLAVVALCGVALTACGEEAGGEPAATASSSESSSSPGASGPACEDVWVDGGTLPEDYAGCVEDGALVEVETVPCASGQEVVVHAGRYYAVPGSPVNDVGSLDDSPDFAEVQAACGA